MSDNEYFGPIYPVYLQPWAEWAQAHPDPGIADLVARHKDVSEAVRIWRRDGAKVPRLWLVELGISR